MSSEAGTYVNSNGRSEDARLTHPPFLIFSQCFRQSDDITFCDGSVCECGLQLFGDSQNDEQKARLLTTQHNSQRHLSFCQRTITCHNVERR
ncbi:hypothetical protein AVEN_85517-1 [Araneus ventricosus]|uniref:Uncharacterized protein n=1 Tax=Araneus ventricosus TaxID=182803 RepID=A0A4Y2KEQ0_ARAVE|nr:hypothetical protein AVEN_85517-1 [Araneus ventricosus]